jgi:hypothetical protein
MRRLSATHSPAKPPASSVKADAPTCARSRRLSNQPQMEHDDQRGKCKGEDHARERIEAFHLRPSRKLVEV